MESRSSTIKINFDVNGASVQRTKDAINSIQSSVEKLSKSLEKTMDKIAKLNTASGGKKGLFGTKKVSVMEGVLGGFDHKESSRSMEVVSANIHKFVEKAIKDIERLKNAQSGLGGGGGGFGGGGGGGGGYTVAGMSTPYTTSYGGYSTTSTAGAGGAEPPQEAGGASGGGGRGGGGKSKGGFWGAGGFEGYMRGRGEALGRFAGLGPPGEKVFGEVGGFVGRMGLPGAVAAGAVLAYNYGAKQFEDLRSQQIDYTKNVPFMRMSSAASAARPFAEQYNTVRSGDVASATAFTKALKRPDVLKAIGSTGLTLEKLNLLSKETPLSGSSAWELIKDRFKSGAASTYGDLMSAITGMEPNEATRKSALQMVRSKAAFDSNAEVSAQISKAAADEKIMQDPRFNRLSNEVYTGAMGRVAAMRMAGVRGGINKKGEDTYASREADLMAQARTWGEQGAGHQRMLQIGSGYGVKGLPGEIGLLSVSEGGLTNVDQLIKSGGMLSGSVGGAKGFYKMIQHGLGRGGLDVGAGRDLYGTLAQQMVQAGGWGGGNAAETYIGLTSGLVGGGVDGKGRTVLDVAEQQRLSNMLLTGSQANTAMSTGKQAPIFAQAGILGSIQAMGGVYNGGAQGLMEMDTKQMVAIARGGDIPSFYQGSGITKEAAMARLRGLSTDASSMIVDEKWALTDNGSLLKRLRSKESKGGTIIDLVKDETSGIKDPGERRRAAQVLFDRFGLMAGQDSGLSASDMSGALMEQAMGDPTFGFRTKGGGVGSPGPSGLDKKALKAQADQRKKDAQFLGKNERTVGEAFEEMPKQADAAVKGVAVGASSIDAQEDVAITAVVAALNQYQSVLQKKIKIESKQVKPIQAAPVGPGSGMEDYGTSNYSSQASQ